MNIYCLLWCMVIFMPALSPAMEKEHSVLGKRALEFEHDEQETDLPDVDGHRIAKTPKLTEELLSIPTPLINAFNETTPVSTPALSSFEGALSNPVRSNKRYKCDDPGCDYA